MLVDIVFGSKAVWRVLSVLAESPGQGITKEEIKKITKLGGDSIFRTINILLKNDIVEGRKVGKRTYYRISMANKYSKLIVEILQNEKRDLNNMNPKIVTILREYTRQINDAINPSSIIVFGSIVKGSYRKDSDIDVAIITEKGLNRKERLEIEKINERLENRFGREIQPHFFKSTEIKNSKEKLVEEIQRDGVRLL